MTDISIMWATRLRNIAEAVKKWEARDLRDQKERGEKLSRPAYFADLEELAAALEGKSARFAATATARQNWPRTVRDFDRDWEIAALVHQHRMTKQKGSVQRGKAEAMKLPGVTEDIVHEADKRYRRYFIDGIADNVVMFLRMKAARYGVTIEKDGGKI
ncbi:hypothetical protein IP68_10485 [Blastomonas sp. AAP25]|uniref:hypothetical protein n=1 Tax=Blastomonas sp. AAP25 TaxID=1523416 RepID=UPI0006B9BB00|nr:hypothetical protein [Blastomonas sp. AAP25]KPF75040.1 hypothetical protein IP68_10485 [Blastomonas sp. AAP25]